MAFGSVPGILGGAAGGGGGLSAPTLAAINSITSATGQTLTLATLDSNQNVIVAPHGTGETSVQGSGKLSNPTTSSYVGLKGDGTNNLVFYSSSGVVLYSGSDRLQLGGGVGAGVFAPVSSVSLGSSSFQWTALNLTAAGTVSWPGLGNSIAAAAGGVTSFVGHPSPSADNTTYGLGRPTLRWLNGYFGPAGIRIGDGTSGANITASGSAGSEVLILTGGGGNVRCASTFQLGSNWSFNGASSNNGCDVTDYQGGLIAKFATNNVGTGGFFAIAQTLAPSITSQSSAWGGASSITAISKPVTGIANATATGVLTITVPNAAHSATLRVTLNASLGAGGAVGANEASACISYDISFTRTAGVNAVGTISAALGSAASAVAGATTCTVTAALSAVSGAVGATNTFTLNVTISRGAGTSTNHTCLVKAEILNANASGITLS